MIPSPQCSFRLHLRPFSHASHACRDLSMTSTLKPQTAANDREEFKDLGFGTEVARGTRRRLLNRDGSFNVVLDGLNPISSLGLYNWLLRISWTRFLAFIAGSYIAINALFAVAFLLCGPNALESSGGYFANHPFY